MASSNQVELPLDILRYTMEAPTKDVQSPQTASFAHTDSFGDDQVHIKVKRTDQKPQALLVQANQQVVNFKKVNMHKRILTEESKRAFGDEDKLFKERQKMI